MKYSKYLSYPLPFYATQIINSFFNARNLTNHDKVEELSANSEIHYKEDCNSIVKSLVYRVVSSCGA